MDKKEVIISTAIRLFVEFGFHGTSTAKIAQQSGVANGTLFNYFRTKDELIFTLYYTISAEMDDFITTSLVNHSITKESFQSLFSAFITWSRDNRILYQYLQQFNHSPYFQQIDATFVKQQSHTLLNLIQNGIDIVLLKPMPAPYIFSLFTAQATGLFNYLVSNNLTENQQSELIQDSFDMIWKMIED